METTEFNELQPPAEPAGILLLQDAQYYLHESGKWAKFLGILGFIGSGFIALAGLFFSTIISNLPQYQQTTMPAAFSGAMGFVYLLMAVFNFFIAMYLYQFGVRIKNGIGFSDPKEISNALGKLKSLFKMSGITAIVVIAIYILVIIGVILAAIILHK